MYSKVKNFILPSHVPNPQKIKQDNISKMIGQMTDQLEDLKKQFRELKTTEDHNPQFHFGLPHDQILKESIQKKINQLDFFLKNFRIMILFCGPISAGKSTFINSMIAQQIMPSRNQQCTKGLILIEHYEGLPEDKAQVYMKNNNGLKEDYFVCEDTVDKVYQFLGNQFEKEGNETLYIRINSYFHRQLPSDFKDRVIFVDTPGFNLNSNNSESIVEYVHNIESLISEQSRDYEILPISIWLANYQSVDHDQDAQLHILSQMKNQPDNKQDQSYGFMQELQGEDNYLDASFVVDGSSHFMGEEYDQKSEKDRKFMISSVTSEDEQQEVQNPMDQLILLVNKIDERKESQDAPLQKIIQQIQNTFKDLDIDKHLFKTSGLMALNYNIMNYGGKKAQEKFIKAFYLDNQYRLGLTSLEAATHYCEKMIKKNKLLLDQQDYEKFLDVLLIRIVDMVQKGFYQKNGNLHKLKAEIIVLTRFYDKKSLQLNENQVEFCQSQSQSLNRKQNFQIQVNKFTQISKANFQIILKNHLVQLSKLKDVNLIQKALLNFVERTRLIFDALNSDLTRFRDNIRMEYFERLQQIFPEEKDKFDDDVECIFSDAYPAELSYLKSCQQIFDSMTETQLIQLQILSFTKFKDSLNISVGVSVQPTRKKSGIVCSLLIATSFFGRQALRTGSALAPVSIAIGVCLALNDLKQVTQNTTINSSEQLLKNIKIWGDSFEVQLEVLATNYLNILNNSFYGVETFLKRLIPECSIV